jgi:transposase
MAIRSQLGGKAAVRQQRYFSEDFRRKKVEEIEKGITRVSELCRAYQVSSSAVYKWIYKYSLMKKKAVKMIVEAQSDTARIEALKEHIAQLEQLLGKKQFEVDFLNRQLQIASEKYGIDLKKKQHGKRSSGSGKTEQGTATQ